MTSKTLIRAGLFSAILALSASWSAISTAQISRAQTHAQLSLPELAPEHIAQDVKIIFDNRSGTQEYVAPTFDPFENLGDVAGTASLRTITQSTAINGQDLYDGAILDLSFFYNDSSGDPYAGGRFEAVTFLSGSHAPIVLRDSRALECASDVRHTSFDHGFHLNSGFYYPYGHYIGHSRFGRSSFGNRFSGRSFGRNFGRSGFSRFIGPGRFGRNGFARGFNRNRNGERAPNRGPNRDRADRRPNNDNGNRPPRRPRRDNRVADDVRNGQIRGGRGGNGQVRGGRTNPPTQGLNNGPQGNRGANRQNRTNRADRKARAQRIEHIINTRTSRPQRTSRPARSETRTNRADSNRAGANTANAPRTQTNRADYKKAATKKSAVKQAATKKTETKRSKAKQSAEKSSRSNRSNARNNASSRRSQGRASQRSNRETGHKQRNFFPNDFGYGTTHYSSRQVITSVQTDCTREDLLSVHISGDILEAALNNGLTLIAHDQYGQELPIFIPANYISGLSLALSGQYDNQLSRLDGRPPLTAPQGSFQSAPQNSVPSTTTPNGIIASCPAGTVYQPSNGTCLQEPVGAYPQ